MSFSSIFWDMDDDPNGNVLHCAAHGVTQDEFEEVLQNPTDTDTSRSTGKSVAFGDTVAGRHLIIVYEAIDTETVYPITAYDVPRKMRS